MVEGEKGGFIPELEEKKEKPPSVPLVEILGAVANRPDLTEEQRRVLETLRPLIMETAKQLAESPPSSKPQNLIEQPVRPVGLGNTEAAQPTAETEDLEKLNNELYRLEKSLSKISSEGEFDQTQKRLEEVIEHLKDRHDENASFCFRWAQEQLQWLKKEREEKMGKKAPISPDVSDRVGISPSENELSADQVEVEKKKWQKEVKEFLTQSKIAEVLADLLKDQNLKQAQEKFHFDDSYAPYEFDIKQMVEEAGAAMQKYETVQEIPANCDVELLLKLDPLTKLMDLPPTIKTKIDEVVKPFLDKLSVLTSGHPDRNGRTSEVFYPQRNEFFDDRNMLGAYEERTGEKGGFGRVLKCLRPGLYSRNTDGTRDLVSMASTVTKG